MATRFVLRPREQAAPSDAKKRLLHAFGGPSYRPPPLPRAGLELREQSRRPEADPRRLVRRVERDPGIATEALRLAHGPAYAGTSGVGSVEQILMRLGSEALNELVLQASLAPLFDVPGYEAPLRDLWRHSLATAHITRIVCRQTALDEDYAFVCGLLHDVGIAVALRELVQDETAPTIDEVWPWVAAVHDDVGATVARHWRLPMDVAFVLQHHHHRDGEPPPHPMASAVCVADRLSVQLGFGYRDDDMDALPRAASALGLTPAVIKLLRRQAEPVVAGIE